MYLALTGLTGSSPGALWQPGFPVALNRDGVTDLFLADPVGGLLANGYGTFDSLGRATAVLTLPPGLVTFLAGWPMYWTCISQTPLGQPSCVGDTRQLLLLP